MSDKPYKIGMISLGCPKNQVDAEQMLGVLVSDGFEITHDQAEADVIVVNTCGFIESAKREAIEAILDAAKMKKAGRCRGLVVAGCLAQRYSDELLKELPEADAIIGTAGIADIAGICRSVLSKNRPEVRVSAPGLVYGLPRVSTTPRHYRYLKIAEGCSNCCSYCAIPLIRGGFRSRPAESVISEASSLVKEGAREIILLAQDSTAYRDGNTDLASLIKRLCRIDGIERLRLMYAYPGRLSDELIAVMADEGKVCKYLDIPIQHIDDKVLEAMNRRATAGDIKRTIEALRKRIPDIALRTSLIVGFPGETDAAFERLHDFVKEAEFDHLGVFTYSPEEGTVAWELRPRVPKKVAEERREIIMKSQAAISLRKNMGRIGKRLRVIVDGMEDMLLIARAEFQAPEIDGVVYLSETEAGPGEFLNVEITQASEYDLIAKAG